MNFQRGRFREEPEINLIPIIDVLLVILIFLMITTTYSKFSGLEINLPTADAAQSPDKPNEINVVVSANGDVMVNRVAVGAKDVEAISVALPLRRRQRDRTGGGDQCRCQGGAPERDRRHAGGAAIRLQPYLLCHAESGALIGSRQYHAPHAVCVAF
jgi:biopolymer transport protein ExbD